MLKSEDGLWKSDAITAALPTLAKSGHVRRDVSHAKRRVVSRGWGSSPKLRNVAHHFCGMEGGIVALKRSVAKGKLKTRGEGVGRGEDARVAAAHVAPAMKKVREAMKAINEESGSIWVLS